jgi:hypothetical protein
MLSKSHLGFKLKVVGAKGRTALTTNVRLVDFSDFASEMKWDVPAEFPGFIVAKAADRMNKAKSSLLTRTPSEIEQKETPEQKDDPGAPELGKSARETLLMIVAGAVGDGLEKQATTAATIERRLQNLGIDRPKKRQILNWLNEAKQLLEERKAQE